MNVYTEGIKTGELDYKEYVLYCARSFGLRHMEDESIKSPVKHRNCSANRLQECNKHKKTLTDFQNLSDEELKEIIENEYKEKIKMEESRIKEVLCAKQRYESTLEKLRSWNPPKDCLNLKNYSIKLLEDSLKFDCDESKLKKMEIEKLTIEEYKQNKISTLSNNIKLYERAYIEEKSKDDSTNCLIDQLIKSLDECLGKKE